MRLVAPGTAFHTIFAETRCEYFGTINRVRGGGRDRMERLELQLEDWKRIKKLYRGLELFYILVSRPFAFSVLWSDIIKNLDTIADFTLQRKRTVLANPIE